MHSVYLHNFNQYNKKNGWTEGDKLLNKFATVLSSIDNVDFIFRVNGDDFIILNKEHFDLSSTISKLEEVLLDTNITMTYTHFNIKENDITSIEKLEKIF